MNPPAQTADTNVVVYLVRRGTQLHDRKHERMVRITPPGRSEWLGGLGLKEAFVVPDGILRTEIEMDGAAIKASVADTSEDVTVHPELRICGVDNGEKLAAAVYRNFGEQLPHLRRLIHGIIMQELKKPLVLSDLGCIASYSAAFAEEDEPSHDRSAVAHRCPPFKEDKSTDPKASKIARRIREELGLCVGWILKPVPSVFQWLKSLMAEKPKVELIEYNKDFPSIAFSLEFTMIVKGWDITKLNKLERCANRNITPQEEMTYLVDRVKAITNPAFRYVWSGINYWNADLIRKIATRGFADVVAGRLCEEFGYKIAFADFTPKPTPAMIESSQTLLNFVKSKDQLMKSLDQKRNEVILRQGPVSTEATEIQTWFDAVKKEKETAESELDAALRKPLVKPEVENHGGIVKWFEDLLQGGEGSAAQLENGEKS